jgi:hypothetical protein
MNNNMSFPNFPHKSLILAILFSSSFTISSIVQADMYKWKDSQGGIHYTQTPPPPEVKATTLESDVHLASGTGSVKSHADSAFKPVKSEKKTNTENVKKLEEDGKKSADKHHEFCDQQKEALQQLTANSLVKIKDDKGEHFLTADEKDAKMKEITSNLDTMCKPEMFERSKTTDSSSSNTSSIKSNNTNETNTVATKPTDSASTKK